jgi:NAD-dependent DNA ligase
MNKAIKKAQSILEKRIEKAKEEYMEAEGSYRDTGYDRYFNKMQRLEKEIDEIEGFMHKNDNPVNVSGYKELQELKEQVMKIKSHWDYIKADMPYSSDKDIIDMTLKDIAKYIVFGNGVDSVGGEINAS